MSESLMSQVEKVLPQKFADQFDNAKDVDGVVTAFRELGLVTGAMGTEAEQLKVMKDISSMDKKGTGVDLDIQTDPNGEDYLLFGVPLYEK